jgi:hypothetical protein
MDWIDLAYDRDKRQIVVNMVMNTTSVGNFLTSEKLIASQGLCSEELVTSAVSQSVSQPVARQCPIAGQSVNK